MSHVGANAKVNIRRKAAPTDLAATIVLETLYSSIPARLEWRRKSSVSEDGAQSSTDGTARITGHFKVLEGDIVEQLPFTGPRYRVESIDEINGVVGCVAKRLILVRDRSVED